MNEQLNSKALKCFFSKSVNFNDKNTTNFIYYKNHKIFIFKLEEKNHIPIKHVM